MIPLEISRIYKHNEQNSLYTIYTTCAIMLLVYVAWTICRNWIWKKERHSQSQLWWYVCSRVIKTWYNTVDIHVDNTNTQLSHIILSITQTQPNHRICCHYIEKWEVEPAKKRTSYVQSNLSTTVSHGE